MVSVIALGRLTDHFCVDGVIAPFFCLNFYPYQFKIIIKKNFQSLIKAMTRKLHASSFTDNLPQELFAKMDQALSPVLQGVFGTTLMVFGYL